MKGYKQRKREERKVKGDQIKQKANGTKNKKE